MKGFDLLHSKTGQRRFYCGRYCVSHSENAVTIALGIVMTALAFSLMVLSLMASPLMAAVSGQQASRLGKDLTPIGAEKAGNAEGTIPEWTGGVKDSEIPEGYISGQHHIDLFPGDNPLFLITRENLDKHRDKLTPGQEALFERYDTFAMPVYRSRRTARQPQRIYDNTRKAAVNARLLDGGNGFSGAYDAYPFPIPANGLEALWNHIVRYRGEYVIREASDVAVQRNGDYTLVTSRQEALFNYNLPEGSEKTLDNVIFYFLSFTKSPARLAGGAVLVHETLDQIRQPRMGWGYNAGQRRVRRAPNLAYDTPMAAADGLRTADDTDLYNGSPDRYNWKLLGKKEIYIPYHNYRLISPELSYDDLLGVGHIKPEHTRYELHRVWVVEGTLKPGKRHIYSKRVLYLDEDSWGAAVVDQYDGRGELWRVSMAYLINYYDRPTVWTGLDVYHDLSAGRYHVQGLANEAREFIQFDQAIPGGNYFKPSALRRRGRR